MKKIRKLKGTYKLSVLKNLINKKKVKKINVIKLKH